MTYPMSGYPTPAYPAPAEPGPRRRRWPIVLVVIILVLAGLFVAADRIAVHQAEDRVATRLAGQNPFLGRPSVRVHGFPFLTQALRGVYSDIEVSGPAHGSGKLNRFDVRADLRGVHIPLSQIANRVKSVPVDRADVSITVALSVLATASGIPGLSLVPDGNDGVRAQAPVPVPGLGSQTLSGTVRLGIVNGAVVGTLSALSAVGIPLPASVAAAAGQALDLRVALSALPFSSVATQAVVQGSDVVISGSARHIVLTSSS